ncbi:unnamed protein product [Vitrella brassicaformis CCMP3155]|uniref:Uncharacterized protein n=1 Tax=Vitrella brassicaformis (strain CCMP3155) TaxID=1169540 RepID=A0A0G4F7I0_VITBC|nr:unnamed protein product [Vitrella brassicaformis CCMP3155]|eukprot:CEM08690.1 unnamed protein product [Vitrella brassicaformis CCMP3155]
MVGPPSHPAAALGQFNNGEASPAGIVAQPQLQPMPAFVPPSMPNSAHSLPPPPPIAVAMETPQFPPAGAQQGAATGAEGRDGQGQGEGEAVLAPPAVVQRVGGGEGGDPVMVQPFVPPQQMMPAAPPAPSSRIPLSP